MIAAAPKIDKAESRRIRVEIRRVLLNVWDPIGVKDEPSAQDEYDGYLGGLYELLTTGASDETVENHLWQIVAVNMGLDVAKKSDMTATVEAHRRIQIELCPK